VAASDGCPYRNQHLFFQSTANPTAFIDFPVLQT
jgi:hypothetical protein